MKNLELNIDYENKILDLTENFDTYLNSFKSSWFAQDSPSIYFYTRALSTPYPNNIELIYATLVAWGMHRMGSSGAKMIGFDEFYKSMRDIESNFREVESKNISTLDKRDLFHLKEIFTKIKVMRSKSIIVAHSKAMANLLPNIVPPIDRQYTMDFFGIKNIYQNKWRGLESEWALFESMLFSFFKPLSENESFQKKASLLKGTSNWDSSLPKIIDNLIVGWRKILRINIA